MSKQCFCPQCGERIADDAEQRYCMFCGKLLNWQTPQASYIIMEEPNEVYEPEPSYKPRWWQTVAAMILFSVLVGSLMLMLFFPEYYYYAPQFDWSLGIARFENLIFAIGIAFLLKGMKNHATMVALVIWIVGDVLITIFTLLPVEESWWTWFMTIMYYIIPLSTVYAFSLIAQNNKLSASDQTWLNLLSTYCVLSLFWITQALWIPQADFDFLPFGYIQHFNLFIMRPLMACGWWILARSAAFGGPYNDEEMCNYTPLNKYMAISLIAPAILILLSLLILNYREQLTF